MSTTYKSAAQAFNQASKENKFDDGFAAPTHLQKFASTVSGLASIDRFVNGTISRVTSQNNLELTHKLIASLMTTSGDWTAYKQWTMAYRASVKHHIAALDYDDKAKKAVENRIDYELRILRDMASDTAGWVKPENPAPRASKSAGKSRASTPAAKKPSLPKVSALQSAVEKDARLATLISLIIEGKADKIIAGVFNKDGSLKKQYT